MKAATNRTAAFRPPERKGIKYATIPGAVRPGEVWEGLCSVCGCWALLEANGETLRPHRVTYKVGRGDPASSYLCEGRQPEGRLRTPSPRGHNLTSVQWDAWRKSSSVFPEGWSAVPDSVQRNVEALADLGLVRLTEARLRDPRSKTLKTYYRVTLVTQEVSE